MPDGGALTPFLPYGRQTIDDADIEAVVEVLRSDFLTCGPLVARFEAAFAETVGASHAVACSSGTAALTLSLAALDVGQGDLCVVPAITFLATANAARYLGADVLFADVDPDTGGMTPDTLDRAIERAGRPVKAVLPVHLGGNAVDVAGICKRATQAGAVVVEDAAHALGTAHKDGRVGDGRLSATTCFSLHPVKTIAAGEGGMVTTADGKLAARLRSLRNHGVVREDFALPEEAHDADGRPNPWWYEQAELGWNYRLPDIACALGLSQLKKLAGFVARRRMLANRYRVLLAPLADKVRPAPIPARCEPGLHLFQVLIDFEAIGRSRREVMERLRAKGVGSQVHYIPVPRQPYWRAQVGPQDLPGADRFYARTLSLPLYPGMADHDPVRVVDALQEALA